MKTEYRGFLITPDKKIPTCLYVATSGKGGKIPDALSGLFTSPNIAKREIDYYLDNKPEKKVRNAQASD